MEKSTFDSRVGKVLANMEREQADCFLAVPSATLKYLTGYAGKPDERLLTLVLAPGKKPFIVANLLYRLQVESTPVEEFVYWEDGSNAIEALAQALSDRGISARKIAVDKTMPSLFSIPLARRFPDAEFVLGNPLTDGLRLYKDETELAAMAQACHLADLALRETIGRGTAWLGKTEAQFLAQLSFEMSTLGLKVPSAIVAVGANAAAPHHVVGDTVIERGHCLLIDFGATYNGYYTDMTRTFHFGEPSDEFKRVYEIVLEALYRGHAAAKIGSALQEVDRAARSYITEQGYGAFFTHRTGHGIGLDGHEGPPAGEGELTPICAGMAFSIEPGIYLPGKFGIRIEDQAFITPEGLRILHSFPRELQVIG